MKYIIALLLAFCFAVNANAAKRPADVPFPPERAFAQAQVTNPDPFNVNRTPQVAPTPVPQPTPVIVQSQPPAETKVSDWGSLGLSGIIAALLGKLAFFNKSATAKPTDSVLHLPNIDPSLRSAIDSVVIQLVQSGAPGKAIRVGLSLIPGAGPFTSLLDPALRAIEAMEVKFLQDRIASAPATDPATAPAVTNVLTVLADLIAKHKQAST